MSQQWGIENLAKFIDGLKKPDVLLAMFALDSNGKPETLLLFPDVLVHTADDIEISEVHLAAMEEIQKGAEGLNVRSIRYDGDKTVISEVSKLDPGSNGHPSKN